MKPLSIITLNVNGLNPANKKQDYQTGQKSKTQPYPAYKKRITNIKTKKLSRKRWKTVCHANDNNNFKNLKGLYKYQSDQNKQYHQG